MAQITLSVDGVWFVVYEHKATSFRWPEGPRHLERLLPCAS